MKLFQANIWAGRLEPQIISLIKELDPDVLCLQEAVELEGGRGMLFASISDIQKAIGAEYAFMTPSLTINYMNRKANFGNAIISKHPFKKTEGVYTGLEHAENFDMLEHDYNVRTLQHVVIETPDGKDVNILNHHGHHIRQHKNGDEETMKQCGMIADYIKKLDGPVILNGDFNLAPDSESLNLLNSFMRNLAIEANLETTRTALTHKKEVCDYVFVNDGVDVKEFKVLNDVISDHMAMTLDFS